MKPYDEFLNHTKGVRILRNYKDFASWVRIVSAVLLFLIIVMTIAQVIFRFVLGSPLTWTDELSRFFLIWMVFVGAAAVSFDDKHLAVNIFQEDMAPRTRLITDLVMRVVIIAYLAVVAYAAIDLVIVAQYNRSGALDIPFSYWRAAVPVGFVLVIAYTIIRSIIDIKNYKSGKLNKNESTGGEFTE